MVAKSTAEDAPARKRISIPPVDVSVIEWWEAQHDASLSVRMLIRAEIERSGYTDVAYRPVTQQPKRGRPPGSASEGESADTDESAEAGSAAKTPAEPVAVAEPFAVPEPAAAAASTPAPARTGQSPIDSIMGNFG